MKTIAVVLCLGLAVALPLFAEMSDSDAKERAIGLWGSIGMIGAEENAMAIGPTGPTGPTRPIDSMRRVGVRSAGCLNSFTELGADDSTWDAAFADYEARLASGKVVVVGPLKGIVLLKVEARDDAGVAGFQFFLDSKPWGPELTLPVAPVWNTTAGFDTSQLADGLHVLCSQARDANGNVRSSQALLIRTDQGLPLTQTRSVPIRTSPILIP